MRLPIKKIRTGSPLSLSTRLAILGIPLGFSGFHFIKYRERKRARDRIREARRDIRQKEREAASEAKKFGLPH